MCHKSMWPPDVHSTTVKMFQDPVHGMIPMSRTCLQIVDTPHFQRLRDLRQLGALYLTFPAGSHSRFEHSVGVSYLAGEMVDRFAFTQPELGITLAEREAVRLAGLCHDLGHGPFSHLFDNEFIPAVRPGCTWSHEQMSMDLFSVLLDDNYIDMEDVQVRLVKDLIAGGKGLGVEYAVEALAAPVRNFMYEIVANKRNGVDADKFDYLERDTHHLGMKTAFNHRRLLGASRVLNDEVCFHVREAYSVYELFHARYSLFKQVYCHRATKAIEYMITDALVEADTCWDRRLSNAIDDPREYWKLTDHVLKEIEVSSQPCLARARAIIYNLRRRKLYKYVDERIVPEGVAGGLAKVTATELVGYNTSATELHVEDIIVQDVCLNYGSHARNPVDATHFFDIRSSASFSVARERVSYILPTHFEERLVRVYSRNAADDVIVAIGAAFTAFMKERGIP